MNSVELDTPPKIQTSSTSHKEDDENAMPPAEKPITAHSLVTVSSLLLLVILGWTALSAPGFSLDGIRNNLRSETLRSLAGNKVPTCKVKLFFN